MKNIVITTVLFVAVLTGAHFWFESYAEPVEHADTIPPGVINKVEMLIGKHKRADLNAMFVDYISVSSQGAEIRVAGKLVKLDRTFEEVFELEIKNNSLTLKYAPQAYEHYPAAYERISTAIDRVLKTYNPNQYETLLHLKKSSS